MSRVRVKICGITNHSDAMSAVNAGVDALGFVFYEPSPRYISPIEAKKIIEQLPPFVTTVGLFVNASKAFIEECISITRLDLLQFHGDEPQPFCSGFSRPYIKAVRVKQQSDIHSAFKVYGNASGLLLDTYVKGTPGGTGMAFDWSVIPPEYRKQVILAGGLDKDNVANAIKQIRPYAVDVSGGVEASKGKKDPLLISSFMNEVNSV